MAVCSNAGVVIAKPILWSLICLAIVFSPEKSKGLEYYADADFAGGWQQADSDDANNVISRTSFIITYVNCPVFLSSKLQTEIVLSTAGYEYIALSSALQ